jgi:hypothetical protein
MYNGKRVQYCSSFRDAITVNAEEDEVWFHVSGYVNSQNSRVCAVTDPHKVKYTPSRDQKFGVWRPISLNRTIGPHVLE